MFSYHLLWVIKGGEQDFLLFKKVQIVIIKMTNKNDIILKIIRTNKINKTIKIFS